MPIEQWSDDIVLVRLNDDPAFTEDLDALRRRFDEGISAVLDFSSVRFVNSSNLGSLLELRKQAQADERRLILCGVGTSVWGALLVTGIDKLFTFVDDVPTALASLQLDAK